MEMYQVAVFLIILNFGFAWVSATGITETGYPNELSTRINEDLITDTIGTGEGGGTWFGEEVLNYASFIADGIYLFITIIYDTTMGLPRMLASSPFNFPPIIVNTLIAFQVIIYGAGIMSFARGVKL